MLAAFALIAVAGAAAALATRWTTSKHNQKEELQAALPASKDAQAVSFAGRTALIVDDEPALVAAYGAMLRNLGLTVREFTNAGDALAALDDEDNAVDILVSDVLMPDLDGPKLVDLAKSLRPGRCW